MALAFPRTAQAPRFDRMAFKAARIYVTLASAGRTANFMAAPEEQEFKCMMAPDVYRPVPNASPRQDFSPIERMM